MKKTRLLLLVALLGILNIHAATNSENYRKLWDNANNLYKESQGSTTRTLITKASQLSSNASDYLEGQHIEYLIDGNASTFWHSDWHSQVSGTHYLQVDLDEAAEGSLVVYVMRRQTSNHHCTKMGLHGSNDKKAWTHVCDFSLGNASSGQEYTTEPLSLGGKKYKYLRFYILADTDGAVFTHFAEFQVTEQNQYGPNYLIDMGSEADELKKLLDEGKKLKDSEITRQHLVDLREAFNNFNMALSLLKTQAKILSSTEEIRKGLTYTIRGLNDEGYLVYNPEVTDKWVSILGATNESFNTIANEAYRETPNLNDYNNVWQFVQYKEKWYLYNLGAKRFLYSDGTTAYYLSSTPTPIHIVQTGEQVFALNGVTDDPESELFASINLSKETKPVQCSASSEHGAQLVLEQATPYSVTVDIANIEKEQRLPQNMAQLTNLPTLFINTFDGTGISSKNSYKRANLWRVDEDGTEFYDSIEIRGRGNSTWGLAKKPYRIKLKEKKRFLGPDRAKARSWTLLANHTDKTLMRNAVASFIGTELGQVFTPAAEFVDLYLNDKYLGNYQISDQVDIKKGRINIVEQEEVPTAESDITGGYFLEIVGSSTSEPVWFSTTKGTNVTIKSPDSEIITTAQKNYIRQFVSEFDERLQGSRFTDPEKGYRPLVDSLSIASWFVSNEFTGNADGYYSIYFYKNAQDDHLYFGPLWDFDIAFNNCYRKGETTNKMMIEGGFNTCNWPSRLWRDPWFRNLTGRLWHKSVRSGMVDRVLAFVDSMAIVLDQSQKENFKIWPLSSRVYDEITLWSTYQEGVDYMKKFIREHAAYLSKTFPDPVPNEEPQEEEPVDDGIRDTCYYRIFNVGAEMAVDISGDDHTDVCIWTPSEDRKNTQQWYLKAGPEGFYRIISEESNLAITDMATKTDGTYDIGNHLKLTETDETNDRQLWRPVKVGDYFYFENRETDLAWNNSNSQKVDGNPIISWRNDADNASKPTRLWRIEEADERLGEDIASMPEDLEYRITYNPELQQVYIRIPFAEQNTALTSNSRINLFDLSGKQLLSGSVQEAMDVSSLPHGVYVLRWTVGPSKRTIKFMKR